MSTEAALIEPTRISRPPLLPTRKSSSDSSSVNSNLSSTSYSRRASPASVFSPIAQHNVSPTLYNLSGDEMPSQDIEFTRPSRSPDPYISLDTPSFRTKRTRRRSNKKKDSNGDRYHTDFGRAPSGDGETIESATVHHNFSDNSYSMNGSYALVVAPTSQYDDGNDDDDDDVRAPDTGDHRFIKSQKRRRGESSASHEEREKKRRRASNAGISDKFSHSESLMNASSSHSPSTSEHFSFLPIMDMTPRTHTQHDRSTNPNIRSGRPQSRPFGLPGPGSPHSTFTYTHAEQSWKDTPSSSPIAAGHTRLFIPQRMYRRHTGSEHHRYVEQVSLSPPIIFEVENPYEWGIGLNDALKCHTKRLADRDALMFCPSVTTRLKWPGGSWSRQIPTKDFRNPPGPITKAKLAKNIATAKRFT